MALDWVWELEETEGDELLRAVLLDPQTDYAGELDAPQCSTILAAAAVVDALAGGTSVELTPEVQAWVAENRFRPKPDLVAAALRGVNAVLGEGSELAALFDEGESGTEWRGSIERLRDSLAALPG